MIFYSKQTGGFYDSEIHTPDQIPVDAVSITQQQHAELLEGQATGQMIVADAEGNPILQDRPGPTVTELIDAKRQAIEDRRVVEEQKGLSYTFPGNAVDVIQMRDTRDRVNVNGQVTIALILKSQNVTDSVIAFQGQSNTTHMLTPDEMIAMGSAVAQWSVDLYKKQWQQKALLDALDPQTASAADVAAVADWPAA